MILPVGEDAARGWEDRAGVGPVQSENEATNACVWTGWKQLRHPHSLRQRALQVLHEVLDGYSDVSPVAHSQNVDRHSLETVVSWRTQSWGSSCSVVRRIFSFWWYSRSVWSWPTVFVQYLLVKDFEEFFESQPHLEAKWQWTGAKRWRLFSYFSFSLSWRQTSFFCLNLKSGSK